MPFSAYSTDPAANTSIGGVNVGENCAPGGLNNAIRQLAADGRALLDDFADLDNAMPRTGGAFEGDITRQTRGAYLHHAGAGQTSGQVHFLASGSPRPTAADGVVVFYY